MTKWSSKTLTSEKLELTNVWHFGLKNDWSYYVIIKTVAYYMLLVQHYKCFNVSQIIQEPNHQETFKGPLCLELLLWNKLLLNAAWSALIPLTRSFIGKQSLPVIEFSLPVNCQSQNGSFLLSPAVDVKIKEMWIFF